ncbi:hypothetical protein K9N50_03960 [bacterium]|nr:hypothetical protein [bacterium]
MAKTKSFAEKMLKSTKIKDDFETYKVIRANTTAKGSIRYENHIAKVTKGDNEIKELGLE